MDVFQYGSAEEMTIADDIMTQQIIVQEAQNRPRFTFKPASMAYEARPPVTYIVNGIIREGGFICFYGDSGSKKTYSLYSMAVCVASGKPWLGFTTTSKPVLIVDEESGERRLLDRLEECLRGELAGPDTPVLWNTMSSFRPGDPLDCIELERVINETGAGMVIIDAFAEIMDGNENDKKDTQPALNGLKRIAEHTGAAIILIHHSGKNNDYRGSTSIKATVDAMIKVESETGTRSIRFKMEKNRDGEPISWTAIATWKEGEFYLQSAENETANTSKMECFILEYLKENGATPFPKIALEAFSKGLGGEKWARKSVDNLKKNRSIYRTNPQSAGRGTEAIFAILPSSNQEAENDD
jgi:hypothetical protein